MLMVVLVAYHTREINITTKYHTHCFLSGIVINKFEGIIYRNKWMGQEEFFLNAEFVRLPGSVVRRDLFSHRASTTPMKDKK